MNYKLSADGKLQLINVTQNSFVYCFQVTSKDPLCAKYFKRKKSSDTWTLSDTEYEISMEDIVREIDAPIVKTVGSRVFYKFVLE